MQCPVNVAWLQPWSTDISQTRNSRALTTPRAFLHINASLHSSVTRSMSRRKELRHRAK